LPAFAAAEDFTVFTVLDFAALAFTAAFLGAGRGGAFPTFLRAGAEAARFTEDFAFADDFLTLERAFAMTASRWMELESRRVTPRFQGVMQGAPDA
jgi:hypothetical protein